MHLCDLKSGYTMYEVVAQTWVNPGKFSPLSITELWLCLFPRHGSSRTGMI
jgi:hypothetical protein